MTRDGLATIPEGARTFGVSEATVRRRIRAHDLPAVKIAGRYRFALADLEKALGIENPTQPWSEQTEDFPATLFSALRSGS